MDTPSRLSFYPTLKVFIVYGLFCNLLGSILINLYSRIEMIVRLVIVGNQDFNWKMLNVLHVNTLVYLVFFWLIYLVPALMIGFDLVRKKFYLHNKKQMLNLFFSGFLAVVIWFIVLKIIVSEGTFHHYFDKTGLGIVYAVFVNAVFMGLAAVILGKFILPKGDC